MQSIKNISKSVTFVRINGEKVKLNPSESKQIKETDVCRFNSALVTIGSPFEKNTDAEKTKTAKIKEDKEELQVKKPKSSKTTKNNKD